MASTTTITKGLVILYKNNPWLVADAQFVNPGKGGAFTRTRLKNLKTDQLIEITFRSGEAVETLETLRKKCQYLYNDGANYHFMDNESYEQFDFSKSIIADAKNYLIDGTECYALYIEGKPVSIQIPPKMTFTVMQTTPGVKGDTATGGSKEATIESGAVIKVPLFIKEGEKIIVNTEEGTYVSKG
ncbi:elongation factor P [Candidatus Peregrinibacteria bacterium]|nr:elongation factor P [Candidatus Peregrinibacteria bacterium]